MTIDDSSTIQKVRGCTLCFSLFIMACGDNSEFQEPNTEPYVTAPTTYSVSFSAMDGGSIDNAGGNFETGAMLTINAIADDGFIFTQWSDGNSENPREISVNSNLTLTAEFLPSFNLNLRVHLMQGEPWLHSSGISMETWVTADNVREHILPELNSIWQIAGVVWELESIINEPMVTYDGYEEDVKYIVDSTRDGSGRSDPNRLPLLYNMMQPSYRSTDSELNGNLFHIYLFPFIGNTSQGNAMGESFGWHAVVGTWSNKHNYGGIPEKTLLTEPKDNFIRGSLSRTTAHELGHVLSLRHDCDDCLMRGRGYRLLQYQIDNSRAVALNRINGETNTSLYLNYMCNFEH